MTFEEVCEHFGNINLAAKAIGVSRQCAYAWRVMGYIPYDKQKRLELKSNGKLISNVNSQLDSLKPKKKNSFSIV